MELFVDLQIASANEERLPDLAAMEKWIASAILAGSEKNLAEAELTVRVVDCDESQQLNFQYRNQDKATNVLSFPFQNPPGITLPLLGDLIVCKDCLLYTSPSPRD